MFQTKATITGFIGVVALAVALFSPAKEVTSADALVGFASGEHVTIHTEQSNKGLLALLLLATVGSAAWTLTGNEEAVSAPMAYRPVVETDRTPTPARPQATPPTITGDTLADFWTQDVAFSLLAQQFDLETRRALLDKAISAHEGGWLETLLCCPCLLVIGRPGSAKSSFAGAMAIAREVLLENLTQTIVCDPNAHLKVKNRIWQRHWGLKGSGDNWKEIDSAISDMYRRFADSQGANYVSSIYDEMTAYEGNVNADRLGGFLPQITSKARAAEEYITLVSHNDTLSCLGGKTGQAKLKDDMVQLNLGSQSGKRGKFYPTGTGTIEGLNFDEKNKPLTETITLPRWFDPAILIHLFPEIYPPDEAETETVTEPLAGRYEIVRDSCANEPQTAPEPPDNGDNGSDRYRLTPQAVRFSAARSIALTVFNETGVNLPLEDIVSALTGVDEGQADSDIIKSALKLGGANYKQGKYILQIIKQSITPNPED